MTPIYDLNKIKFATDEVTFNRAVGLYENSKVTKVKTFGGYYSAVVLGTEPYHTTVSARTHKQGHCTCYLGQQDIFCKHRVALALHAVMEGRPLTDIEKNSTNVVEGSRRRDKLSDVEFEIVKKGITDSLRYIRPYRGPSRTWFANQDSLREGCNRLSAIVSDLPVNPQTSEILIKLLLRLDKKLRVGGVDDSNGIVGGFMNRIAGLLEEFVRIDPKCVETFKALIGIGITSFGWEEPLVRILDET